MIAAFQSVKDTNKPVVVHLNTLKGKGYKLAETYKEPWHWSVPFDIESGDKTVDFGDGESLDDLTYNYLNGKIKNGENVAILVAGTPGVFGLNEQRRQELGAHYVDVGIAEEHAMAMSSALAKGGCRPVFCVHSSFLQRTYDQLSQDLALNRNPAVILVYWSGLSSADATHLGCFDMAMASNIPNITFLTPATKEEYMAMLDWAMTQKDGPVMIRVPNAVVYGGEVAPRADEVKAMAFAQKGEKIALLAVGEMLGLAQQTAETLKTFNINASLAIVRCVSELDTAALESLKDKHKVVITLEGGVISGGFGEKIARYFGNSELKVLNYGAKKEFTDRLPLDELYRENRLLPQMIAEDALKLL